MIGVRNSRDPRAGIQNGFWGIKYLIIIAGCIGAFFIPHGGFGPTWMYFGMMGGFLFIIIQLVLIIDFAHSWAESWMEHHKNSNDQSWFYALLSVTGLFYLATLVTVILSYSYYTGDVVGQCKAVINNYFSRNPDRRKDWASTFPTHHIIKIDLRCSEAAAIAAALTAMQTNPH